MYDVPQDELIRMLSQELKPLLQMPEWANFVKTGAHKDRPPVQVDWWHLRAASVLRQVHLKGPIGVSKLRFKYGGKKNRGMKPERFQKGSGKIIRTMLQQLEDAKLIKQDQKGVHKGRVLTSQGKSLLFTVSKKVTKAKPEKPKVKPAKQEAKPDDKQETKPSEAKAPEQIQAKAEAKPEKKDHDKKEEKSPEAKEVKEEKKAVKTEAKPEKKESKPKEEKPKAAKKAPAKKKGAKK
ncbi:30S ribosomal protein S19e [Nanoarchaeota archaeon]